MKKISGLIFFSLLVVCCTDTTPPPSQTTPGEAPAASTENRSAPRGLVAPPPVEQTYRGMYASGSRGASFYDCSTGLTYRVSNTRPPRLDSLYHDACAYTSYDGESAYAVVRGRVQPEGNTARYAGVLSMTRVDTLMPKTMFNTCMPYDFWCMGTEPFWGLFIAEKEGGLFLKIMGEEKARAFPWAPPATDKDSWIYSSTNPATKENLHVRVRRATCTDGMSDRRYDYSVEISTGEQQYQGCAVRGRQ